jgi:outer membrane protein, heavy metal efflux system
MRFLFLGLLFFFGCIAIAQNETITLQKAIENAILRNPEIHRMDARIEAAKNQWRLVSGIHSPEISYFREGIGEPAKFAEQRLAISQSFDFPLTIAYRHQALKLEYQALEYDKQHLLWNITADVKKKYIELMFSMYHLDLMKEQKQLAEEIYNVASDRSDAGMGSDLELLKAQIGVAESENDVEKAALRIEVARNQLIAIASLQSTEHPEIFGVQDTLQLMEEKLLLPKAENFIFNHPLYKSTQARLEAAAASLKEARSMLFPDITASYYQQDYGNGYDFHGFEIGLRIPLWFPLERQGMVNVAKAGISDIEWQMHGIETEIRKETEIVMAGYRTGKNAIDRYDATIRSRSKLLQQLTMDAYRIGSVDLLNVLDARQTFLQSQTKYLDELKNFYIQITEIEKYKHETIIY